MRKMTHEKLFIVLLLRETRKAIVFAANDQGNPAAARNL
jgi:hypothetical protein